MVERVVSFLTDNYALYERQNLSSCELLIHAQDFVRFIIKRYDLDNHGYDNMSMYSRIKEVISYLKACKITPLFVVDGTLDPNENVTGILPRIICEFLSSVGVSFVVSRSSAVCTCLALAEQHHLPLLIAHPGFYVNFYSLDSTSRPIFLPIECLQNLNTNSSELQAKRLSNLELYFPQRYLYLGCLLMELIDLPPNANKDLEVGFVLKWLRDNSHEPLNILQQIIQPALQSDDPCLVTQMMINYLISLTPDYEEASAVSSWLGLKTTKSQAHLDSYDSEPGSPQFFFSMALHILEGKSCHHSKIRFNDPTVYKLFCHGKIDSPLLCPIETYPPPIRILRQFQNAVISKSNYIDNAWAFITDYFHFSIFHLDERIAIIVLCCLLWHSCSSCSGHTPEHCPVVLSTVFCSLINIFCKQPTEAFSSTMVEYAKSEKLELNHTEEDFLKQGKEILQIYSEFLSFCSVVNSSKESSKLSLFKQVSFEPIFLVFPCLRMSALLAAKLSFSKPENRLSELLSSSFLQATKLEASDFSLAFHHFMDLIKNTEIYWDEPPSTSVTSAKMPLTEVSEIPKSMPPVEKPQQTFKPDSRGDSHSDNPTCNKGLKERRIPGSLPISASAGKQPFQRTTLPSVSLGQPDYDRPKTPPPANIFMKKTKQMSKYAALLVQRFGDKN
nr:hypothetical protein HmN_000634200 [Hymenolepis microstoma]